MRSKHYGWARHLRYLVDRYSGDLPLALAAYNAGVEAVARYGDILPYTDTHVARVLRLAQAAAAHRACRIVVCCSARRAPTSR